MFFHITVMMLTFRDLTIYYSGPFRIYTQAPGLLHTRAKQRGLYNGGAMQSGRAAIIHIRVVSFGSKDEGGCYQCLSWNRENLLP